MDESDMAGNELTTKGLRGNVGWSGKKLPSTPIELSAALKDLSDHAFLIWSGRTYRHRQVSERLKSKVMDAQIYPQGELIRSSRRALFLSLETVANRYGISKSAFARLEKSEANGSIKLKTLMGAAEALNCELVYFLRPKSNKTFAQIIWDSVFTHLQQNERVKSLRYNAGRLAGLVQKTIDHPRFKEKMGWHRRDQTSETGSFQVISREEVKDLKIF